MTYEEALAYITPSPNSHGTILLRADKLREAIAVMSQGEASADPFAADEECHPEWIWYGKSREEGIVISTGRWAKRPFQRRYKLANTQATEHDHD